MRADIMVEPEPVVEKPPENHLNNTSAWNPVADCIPWGTGAEFRDVPATIARVGIHNLKIHHGKRTPTTDAERADIRSERT